MVHRLNAFEPGFGADFDALIARRGGTVVLAGLKGSHHVPDFASDRIVMRKLTVKGVFGVEHESFRKAVALIESGRYPLDKMLTHSFPLDQAEEAIQALAGGEAINVTLQP